MHPRSYSAGHQWQHGHAISFNQNQREWHQPALGWELRRHSPHSQPTAQQSNLARAHDDSTQTHFNYVFLTNLLLGQVLNVTSDKWLTNLCDPAYVLQWVKEVHSRHGSIWLVYLEMTYTSSYTSLTRNASDGWGAAPFTRYPVARLSDAQKNQEQNGIQ